MPQFMIRFESIIIIKIKDDEIEHYLARETYY